MGREKFEIGGQGGKLYNINLKEMRGFSTALGSYKLKSTRS